MTKKLRIGVLGLVHDHVWGNLNDLTDAEGAELLAVADPNQPLLNRVKDKYGCATYLDHETMLERERLDAVWVFADNARGAELTVRAAKRGLHVMVEKPMAADLAGAERMIDAVERAGVRLMINWPIAWRPQVQEAIALAAGQELGDVWQLSYRVGHAGPKRVGCSAESCDWLYSAEPKGGGAMLDFCSYGVNVAVVLLGRPERLTGIVRRLGDPDLAVEDNAMIAMSYPRAMAVAEGSWTQVGSPTTGYLATIYGTKGAVIVGPGAGGRLWMAKDQHNKNVELTPPPPAPQMANGTAHFLWALETGNEFCPLCRPAVCRDTQEVLDAAIRSAKEGASVTLPQRGAGPHCMPDCFRR